jgi:hypothetical protein
VFVVRILSGLEAGVKSRKLELRNLDVRNFRSKHML